MYMTTVGTTAPTYKFYSSFNRQEIVRDHYVLTVLSGSTWTGGHAAMFLEHLKRETWETAETLVIDLQVQGGAMKIKTSLAQEMFKRIARDGWEFADHLNLPKGGDPAQLATTNHRCYEITSRQRADLLAAVARFDTKMKAGRYTYSAAGGALGFIGSTIGHRGINCADFVIKVLNEAGISNRHNSVFNTPSRIAKSR